MRTKLFICALVLAGLVVSRAVPAQADPQSPAQPNQDSKQPGPSSLEEMLAKALRQNPDILVAEAKARLAEAELYRAQQTVLGKIVILSKELTAAKLILVEAETRLARLTQQRQNPGGRQIVTDEEYGAAQVTKDKYYAEMVHLEAELSVLVGKKVTAAQNPLKSLAISPDGKVVVEGVEGGGVRVWDLTTGKLVDPRTIDLTAPTADKVRNALETPVKINFKNVPLSDMLQTFQAKTKGVNLFVTSPDFPVSVSLQEPVTLLAALQLLEDRSSLRFVVREYGIVGMDVEHVPLGATLVSDFAKQPVGKTTK